ncbi:MAG: DUF2007 domain-containing protein [Bacteroidales bacterium]|nr:DUF2007 domain-containing protein [Bacteroidales bacterium]MDD3522251.1 DUF2007 domain-containing protein [Bacteroidales bacterium]MDD4031277.1 DUF2007 domain-containing protein [Bacteroidales bacterium]MDD4435799.1 DUF2007 domain-containing protein [Bacteroidales bacterium]MDD5733323.1 DUF2007 domain-containing protein [Bacteroidales bacterium]
MKTVARCNNIFQAEVIKGNLENQGFHPVVFDNSMDSFMPLDTLYKENKIVVNVPDQEYEAAQAYLDSPKNQPD